jgi:hypothetical protein
VTDNLLAPVLQSPLPNYPLVEQDVRVSAASIGGNVYPGFVQQYAGSLAYRDREACYVWEPNGVSLTTSIYGGRLVGSHLGLPLYAVACCVPGTVPAGSSSSTSAGSASGGVSRFSTGTANSGGVLVTGIAVPSVTTRAGLLIVNVATFGNGRINPEVRVTFAGVELETLNTIALPGTATNRLRSFFGIVPDATDTIQIDLLSGSAAILANSVNVTGLPMVNFLDQLAESIGGSATPAGIGVPDTGPTPPLNYPTEYANGAILMTDPVGAWSWANGFASGGQDVTAAFGGLTYWLTEGWRTAAAPATVDAALTGTSAAGWAAGVWTYK